MFCPLHYAAKNGYMVVKALLEKDADPNAKDRSNGNTAFHLLAEHWDTDEDSNKGCLDVLLACNKTIMDVLNFKSESPLFTAAYKGHKYMVEQPLYKGANIKATYYNTTAEDIIKSKFPGLLDSIDFSAITETQKHLGSSTTL